MTQLELETFLHRKNPIKLIYRQRPYPELPYEEEMNHNPLDRPCLAVGEQLTIFNEPKVKKHATQKKKIQRQIKKKKKQR